MAPHCIFLCTTGFHGFIFLLFFPFDVAVSADSSEREVSVNVCVTEDRKGLRVERERNLACNKVIVTINCSVYCTVEQKWSACLFLSAQCQFVAFAFEEELARQVPDIPWMSSAVPPGPGLAVRFFRPKQNSFLHPVVLPCGRDIGNWLNEKFHPVLLKK